MEKKAGNGKAIILPEERVAELLSILKSTSKKLYVTEGCCRDINSEEAGGIAIIVKEVVASLYDAREILEEAEEGPV